MKKTVLCLAIKVAPLIALPKGCSFDVIDICYSAEEIKKLAAHGEGELSRECRMRQKSIERKIKKKAARRGGKP